jgi:hypothetical protein
MHTQFSVICYILSFLPLLINEQRSNTKRKISTIDTLTQNIEYIDRLLCCLLDATGRAGADAI